MKIQMNENQPTFNGYLYNARNILKNKKGAVNSSLKNRIEKIIETERKNLIEKANIQHKSVNKELIEKHKEQGERVIAKWNQFMKPQNKNTGLFLVDWFPRDCYDQKYEHSYLAIKNPIMKGEYRIYAGPFAPEKKAFFGPFARHFTQVFSTNSLVVDMEKECIINAPYAKQKIETLDSLENAIDAILAYVKPKDVDKAIFESTKSQFKAGVDSKGQFSLLERVMLRQKAKKIDKFAKEQGFETFATEYLENIFNKIKNNNKII